MSAMKRTPLPQLAKRLKQPDQCCLNCKQSEDLQGTRIFCLQARKRIGIGGWCTRWL